MKIELSFAELHTPWFFNRKSYGQKIEAKPNHRLVYDRENSELLMYIDGKEAIVPISNVVIMVPGEQPKSYTAVPPKAEAPKAKVKAQVSDPVRDAVFGPGK